MIRIFRKSWNAAGPGGRRRVSNQLAAFAAVMLFASTQVEQRIAGGNDPQAGSAGQALVTIEAGTPEAPADLAPLSEQPVQADAPSSRTSRGKGIKLSLFLFGR